MKTFIQIFLLFSGLQFIYSQNTISGNLIDSETKQPISNATISIQDLKISINTDATGKFVFENINGTYMVEISADTFAKKIISLSSNIENSIELSHSVTDLQEVVVTGNAKATDIKKTPIPITTISAKFLEQNKASNLVETISKIPGISNLSSGPNLSKPIIRGLGYNRVLVLFDGIRQDGQQWGDEHGVEIDQEMVDRVEIVKGPSSLMYGSDALAGVVNFLPEKYAKLNEIKGGIETEFQTNNVGIGVSANIQGNNNGLIWGTRFSYKQASSYKNEIDNRVFGTKFKESNFNLYLGLNKSWGYSTLNFSYFDDKQEVPTGERDEITGKFVRQITEDDTEIVSDSDLRSYSIDNIHQRIKHFKIASDTHFHLGEGHLDLKFSYQNNIRQEFSHPEFTDLAGLNLNLKNSTYDVKYIFPKFNELEIIAGFNGLYQDNTNNRATDFLIPDYISFDFGTFVYMKREFGKLNLSAGLRYDYRTISSNSLFTETDTATGFDFQTDDSINGTEQFSDQENDFNGISASLGATYEINNSINLKLNVGRGYRAPNITEISAKGVHPGTDYQQLGSSDLKSEQNIQTDFGLFYNKPHFSASFEVFYNHIDNYIFNQKLQNSDGTDVVFEQNGKEYQVFKFQQTKARLFGFETSFDFHPLDWIHLLQSVSAVYTENLGGNGIEIKDDNKYLPFIPPLKTNTEIRFDINDFHIFKNTYFKVGMQYFDKQNSVFSNNDTETPTSSYILFDAGIGTSFNNKNGKKLCDFKIITSNLLNENYQSHVSRMKYMSIYNMGRNISFNLAFHF